MAVTTKAETREWTDEGMERIWNEGDLDYIDEVYVPDLVMHDIVEGTDYEGREAFKTYVGEVLTAFLDFEVEHEDSVIGDGKYATRYVWRGTHEGVIGDLEPTNRSVEVRGVMVGRTTDEKVVEAWWYRDVFGMVAQVGFIPEELLQ